MGGEAGIIEVPPLRQRRWEVPLLAAAVLEELTPRLALAPDAVRKLLLYEWPLNHWELEDVLREAHSVAASRALAEIPAHLLKLRTPPPQAGPSTPDEHAPPMEAAARAFHFPPLMGWRELFQALRHFGTFTAVRDAWQQQLGAQNAATVNRRIGRLLRCDHCDPATCMRCFSGVLRQSDPMVLLKELVRMAGGRIGDAAAWVINALSELVVERLESFRTDAIRGAVEAARSAPDRDHLLALISALRS